MKPKHIKRVQSQSRKLQVRRLSRDTLAVESASEPGVRYTVSVAFDRDGTVRAQCNCLWADHHGVACSHVMAALEYLATLKQRTLSFWSTAEEAQRQKQRIFYLVGHSENGGVWITSRSA